MLNLLSTSLPAGLLLLAGHVIATDDSPTVSVPPTCTEGFTAGSDTALLTVPYSPAEVVQIVGDFQNLTWSGNTPDTVTLNGTNNQVGTARSYSLQGLNVIETLTEYYRPDLGCFGVPYLPSTQYAWDMAYVEAHNTAEVTYNGDSVYMPFDGLTVQSHCLGQASVLNYSVSFCATDVPTTQGLLHALHMQDLQNVQAMLGNNSFTSCQALYTAWWH